MSGNSNDDGFAQSGEGAARDALDSGERAARQSARAAEQSYSATAESLREMQLKLIDMAQAHTNAMFDFVRQIAHASGPSDIVASCTAQGRKQFETLTAQANELTALGQKIASSSTAPIMQSARQTFGVGT
jgi:hypothetical protein